MQISLTPACDADRLHLPALLDLTAAEALHRTLLTGLDHPGGLDINGSDVERVSTPCLQLLVAASIGLRARQRPFRLHAPSHALGTALRDLGLMGAIGLPPDPATAQGAQP